LGLMFAPDISGATAPGASMVMHSPWRMEYDPLACADRYCGSS